MPPQQGAAPRQQESRPGLPPPLIFEAFGGVNTATTRPGVPDEMAYWLDGFMPLAPRNLRTLYGIGPTVFTAGTGQTIVCFYFYNIGATAYSVLFLSDGSAVQVDTTLGTVTTILPTGTIQSPAITDLGVSQYGEQYLLIVANQTNGYWVWDGSVLYSAGSLAPTVTLTNVGSGYQTVPIVTATGGSGSGATFVATINNGVVSNVTITNAGTGYRVGDTPVLVFTGGTGAGSGASFTANMAHKAGGSGAAFSLSFTPLSGNTFWKISGITITNSGSGYSGLQTVNINTTDTIEIPASITLIISGGGGVAGAVINNGGSYVTTNPTATITMSISDPGFFFVNSVTINNGGSGYTPGTIVLATGGSPYAQATFTPVLTGGAITSLTINYGGAYSTAAPPTIVAGNTQTTAAGTVNLMPFGIQGNAVQTYQGHVWVFNGSTFNFSAPGSVFNFATSAGGGSQQSSVNYLKVSYTQAISTNGFLFLVGDSSMDYISGVTTTTPSGGSPTTTFTQNNSDPEQGSPYPAVIDTLGQDIILANSTGVFVSSGGAFTKKSEALDGVFNSVPNFNGQQLSSAKATIFNKRIWMCLVPIIDPVSGEAVNKLLLWNGKQWWASVQDVALSFIQGQEINSVYTAWGTDSRRLFRLFNTPSSAFTKVAQTRFWDTPGGYDYSKSAVNLFAIAQFYGVSDLSYNVTIDNETGLANTYTGNAATVIWTNEFGVPVTWQNSLPENIVWFGTNNLSILPPTAIGQYGVLIGMTITTQADDMALITIMMQPDEVQYRA